MGGSGRLGRGTGRIILLFSLTTHLVTSFFDSCRGAKPSLSMDQMTIIIYLKNKPRCVKGCPFSNVAVIANILKNVHCKGVCKGDVRFFLALKVSAKVNVHLFSVPQKLGQCPHFYGRIREGWV
jgi:hypothetical protein